jgi:hypothetical protein
MVIAITLTTLACSLSVPSFTGITGSGNVITLEQDLADFDRLEISYAFEATITQGDVFSVVIRIDDNLQPYLRVQQQGGTLSIGLDSDVILGLRNATLEADITMPNLVSLEASGASQADLVDFIVEGNLVLDASGASKIGGDLQANDVRLTLSGASSASLSGSGGDLTVDASGASTADLRDFEAVDVVVVVSGASSATVLATGTLTADASGASHVTYLGDPTVLDVNTSGASSVEPD